MRIRWLISHVQITFQTLPINVLRQLAVNGGGTAAPERAPTGQRDRDTPISRRNY